MKDQSQVMKNQQPQMMTQQPPQMMTHHPQLLMTQQPQMLTQRSFGMWPPMNFPNPQNPQVFVGPKTRNWKVKKGINNKGNVLSGSGSGSSSSKGVAGYRPPTLNELQHQNRVKARRFFNPKKKFNNRFAPYAPRNTTSFLIRAKKSGGIASLVSPCPVTPAVLPTPMFSPSREVLGDMAKEEWGVDGYGSMKGLIRLRSPGGDHEDDEEGGDSSSDSDVEEHVEVERRLDHDLSRFEMIYPSYGGVDYNNVLENRVDDQDTHIAHLEEENLILKERLFLMEREVGDLRRRMQFLERRNGHVAEEINEEVVDNVSENDSESRDDGNSMDGNKYNEEDNRDEGEEVEGKQHGSYGAHEEDCARDVCMNEFVNEIKENVDEDLAKDQQDGDCCDEKSSKINDDISMEGETSVQGGVAAEEDELKEVDD